MLKHLPNLLTLANSLAGAFAIYFALYHSDLKRAMIAILLAAVLDFFDGFAARLLKAFSPLGKDLDSLSDVVSFGVAPAVMMVVALEAIHFATPWVALLIVPASVYRLAKFNNDTRQSVTFIGLPTPANALFFGGLSYWILQLSTDLQALPIMIEYKAYPMYYLVILGMCYLLVSEVPMFSLKGAGADGPQTKRWHGIKVGSVVVVAIIGLLLWSFSGFALAILLYILINLWDHLKSRIP